MSWTRTLSAVALLGPSLGCVGGVGTASQLSEVVDASSEVTASGGDGGQDSLADGSRDQPPYVGGDGSTLQDGSSVNPPPPPSDVVVGVVPSATSLLPGESVQLTAVVSNATNGGVTWTVLGTGCGEVTGSGSYTAPGVLPVERFCRVRATSQQDGNAFGTSTIAIVEGASVGEPGVWTRANLPISLDDPNSGGAQTVLVDPVRPSDIYSFVTPTDSVKMVVLKSTDYGATWRDVNTTTDLRGNPWGAAIDPNPNRDPNTPPTLYTPAGFGNHGVWKSTDGGATWRNTLVGSVFDGQRDAYQIAVLPDNPPNHLLFTYHYNWPNNSDAGFGESFDGGQTWVMHPPPAGIGGSQYLIIIDKDTWLSVAQGNQGRNGIWKTSTAGRVNGVISTGAWKKVDTHEHPHGAFGAYVDAGTGTIYVPGEYGVKVTKDRGETWESVYEASGICNVTATSRFLYGNCLSGPNLLRADRNRDTVWASYTEAPANLRQGSPPFGSVATFDGKHWILIMNADDDGIWRYVEPE